MQSILIAIVLLGIAGLSIATYIRKKKTHKQEHFVCPLRGNCGQVVHSRFGRFLGVPVERLGQIYYAGIVILYTFTLFGIQIPELFSLLILLITAAAFVFSIYLTLVQMIILRRFCTWCLCSAAVSTSIFVLVLIISPYLNAVFSILT